MNEIYVVIVILAIGFILYSFVRRRKNSSGKYNDTGLYYLDKAMYREAIEEFKNAAELESESNERKVMYLRNVGLAYHELDEYESAFYYKKEALKYCELNSYNYFIQKGDIGILTNDIDSAIINLRKALHINPEKLEANNSIGLIYLGDYGEVYENLEKALFHNKKTNQLHNDSVTKNVLARTYYLMKEYEKAEVLFREILQKNGDDLNSKFSLAMVCYYRDNREEAKRLFKEIFAEDRAYIDGIETILYDLKLNLKTNK